MAIISIEVDTRRIKKKTNKYPVKLRVYQDEETKWYPTIFEWENPDDFDTLNSKRIRQDLIPWRDKFKSIETEAAAFALKIVPFDFNEFYIGFVKGNPLFVQRKEKATVKEGSNTAIIDWEDWETLKKHFPIIVEPDLYTDNISVIYQKIVLQLLKEKRVGTAMSYQSSYNSFKSFKGNVRFIEVTKNYLKEYEFWMTDTLGNSRTSVGFYARALRAVFKEAIDQKLISAERYPFGEKGYIIPTGRKIKKAINDEGLAKIYYTPTEVISEEKARAFWMFIYYANGMNAKDFINLKFKNKSGIILKFIRAKTQNTKNEAVEITCILNDFMLEVIDKYGNKDTSPENYIFPILEHGMSPLKQHRIKCNFCQFINKNMDRFTKEMNLPKKPGIDECRHTFATALKRAKVPGLYIKDAMGHASLNTTENYFDGFEDEQQIEYSKGLDKFKSLKPDQSFL